MAASETETTQTGSMAESIAASTRVLHARLNRLIMARLQLALPPRIADPSLYISGLFHIAPIYITFETLWESILESPPKVAQSGLLIRGTDPFIHATDSEDKPPSRTRRSKLHHELHSALQTLRLPGLMRSSKLKEDLGALTGWPEQVVQEQLNVISESGHLAHFLDHMRRSINSRPHVLIAYAYIFFMALFAGGRFIRASLESVGHAFWDQCPSPIRPNMMACEKDRRDSAESLDALETSRDERFRGLLESHGFPLGFFHFSTPMDGEDLKREFKKRLSGSETVSTAQEKDDIVKESVCIFENMILLVRQLDEVCEVPGQDTADDMMARLRDSVSVTRERRDLRNSTRRSDNSICSVVRSQGRPNLAKSASENDSDVVHDDYVAPFHPRVAGFAGNGLCPGLPKSMRFDQTLPKPNRHHPLNEELAEFSKNASMARYGRNVVSCILFVAFGIMFAGALVTGQKGLLAW
ncbi:unnamed protein product [Clonostachys byssicola]|uniref:Heme-binding protein HMX1 n=1 Tax=Clonostachys byssicola TaxID=160290 RepID=A0A9N9YDY9_9HYPO|nr:unnamed protein product [Clonostachys byssicola]